jgi:hypothetical protein
MAVLSEAVVATVVLLSVTASFPCFVYGAWYILNAEAVTWGVLMHHLKFVVAGLLLTTVPMLFWMVPRLPDQFGGPSLVHAFLGLQAYALLAFGGTGILRVFRAKRRHDLYNDYDEDVLVEEIGSERMSHWRARVRIGVFGYVIFWVLAYLVGLMRYLFIYIV